MRNETKGRRIFGAVILFMLIMLATGTMVFARTRNDGSYSLVIEKKLAAGSPKEAYSRTYKFEITGWEKKRGLEETKPYSNIVEIKGNGQISIGFDNIANVSVRELTDKIEEIPGWELKSSSCEVSMEISRREYDFSVSGENSRIMIEKLENGNISGQEKFPGPYVYKVASIDEEGETGEYSETVTLAEGESRTLEGLSPGRYRVTAGTGDDTGNGNSGSSTTGADISYELTLGGSNTVDIWGGSGSMVSCTNTFSRDENGSYWVVHEYYLKHKDGSFEQEDVSSLSKVSGRPIDDSIYYTADQIEWQQIGPNNNIEYPYFRDYAYGKVKLATSSNATPSDATPSDPSLPDATPSDASPSKTPSDATPSDATPSDAGANGLSYNAVEEMKSGAARIKAENFETDDTEEDSGEEILLVDDVTVKEDEIKTASLEYEADDNMDEGVIATVNGEQVIILRYYRVSPEEPDKPGPEDPGPEDPGPGPGPGPGGPGSGGGGSTPGGPTPGITIVDENVPQSNLEVLDEIPEEEVPLWGLPKTGDERQTGLWVVLLIAALSGMGILGVIQRKKKKE